MTEIALGSTVIVALVVGLAAGLLSARRRLIPDVGLDVTVNDSLHLAPRRGAKLLDVLHGAGIQVPAACGGSGTCGLCRVTVTGDGAGEPQATERGVLSPRSDARTCAWPARPACAATARCTCPTTS